jgi:predicted component of type VI protein secretion system
MEIKNNEDPVLIAQTGPLNGERWMLSGAMVVGRDASCEIVIPDRQVSRFHARLLPTPEGVVLEDLGSKNGTFVNGAAISDPVHLQDGDLVQISLAQHFVYLSSDATMPLQGPFVAAAVQPVHPASAAPADSAPAHGLRLDERSRRVWVNKVELLPPLSAPQFSMLQLLTERMGDVVTREELIDAIWGSQQADGVSEQALDALVRRLRDRLAAVDPGNNYIVTVRGHGLRLENF